MHWQNLAAILPYIVTAWLAGLYFRPFASGAAWVFCGIQPDSAGYRTEFKARQCFRLGQSIRG